MRFHVDEARCEGHGRCYAMAPALFAPDDLGFGHEQDDGRAGADQQAAVRLAAANCPERAIVVEEER